MDLEPKGGGGSHLGESGPLTVLYPMEPLAQGGGGSSDPQTPPPAIYGPVNVFFRRNI